MVREKLETNFRVTQPNTYDREACLRDSYDAQVIFTNPNDLGFRYDQSFMDFCGSLQIIATASTGTDHLDLDAIAERNIKVICLRDDRDFMDSVTATAEHAVCLTLMALRKIPAALDNISSKRWSWQGCVGRQVSSLRVGVVGMGRLGTIYAKILDAMGASVKIYDPFIPRDRFLNFKEDSLAGVLDSDVVSLHIHASDENRGFVSKGFLEAMPSDATLINTSRGSIVDELALASHLETFPEFTYATDVLSDELLDFTASSLLASGIRKQVILTPHIGGMTRESRHLAYGRAAQHLVDYVQNLQDKSAL